MKARFATEEEIVRWDDLLLANPDGGNVFASYEFAIQKKMGGYRPRFVVAGKLAITVLEKRPFPGVKLWYLPKGPGVSSTKQVFEVLAALRPLARHHGVFMIRIEPELSKTAEPSLQRHGLTRSEPIIPNPSTILIDISPKLDKVLEALPQKGRHAIRRGEREGVRVELVKATDDNCRQMYDLLLSTAEGRFGIRNYDYFHSFWQRFEAADMGQMFFAYDGDNLVAGAYALVMGQKSTYKDGASSRQHPVYGATHFLQWEVIKWAKSKDATIHDLCGSPPSDQIKNPDHKHYGIGLFKTAFNREVTDYVGCYDYIVNRFIYKLWALGGERLVKRLHYARHHDLYY